MKVGREMGSDRLYRVLRYIDDHKDEYVGLLQRLCRQPSVAATGEGIGEMVALVKDELRSVGSEPVEFATPGNPVIYARIEGESYRTFGFYDHYDVQPVDPIELWIDDPYSAVIRDGALFARGAVDNKNGIAAKLCAVDAFTKAYGRLPCGVKFFIEGEEEIGSPHLVGFAKAHEELLDCDGFNWESGWKEPGQPPQIDFGVKGMLYVEMRSKCADTDSHSANAAIVPNPAWRLIWALGTIKDSNDKILIDHFYDDIASISAADIDILAQDPFSEKAFAESLGAKGFINGLTGRQLLKKYYYEPTANICGIVSGYAGDGSKTVLPASASVKMDFRLVPGQDPDRVFKLLREHLDCHGFRDIELVKFSGALAFRSDPDSVFARAVVKALTGLYGRPIIHHTLAGTSPMSVFCAKRNIPVASFGGTGHDANMHAPNEHIIVDSYIDEIKMIAAVMNELAEIEKGQ